MWNTPAVRRVRFVTHSCLLDPSNGAAVASRELTQSLARWGWPVEVLCGTMLDRHEEVDPAAWLREQGFAFEASDTAFTLDARGTHA